MNTLRLYLPSRIYTVFIFLLSLYLIIKKKDRFLFFRPLPPKKLKTTIVDLGASFIKLAQVLATRADFFSQEYLDELKELHDQIPQMDHTSFQCVFKEAFGDGKVFKSFENTPIASASIGQVHKAYLQDGTLVAVKLRRKGIKARVIADTKIIRWFHTLF